jgi:hypothetical protein
MSLTDKEIILWLWTVVAVCFILLIVGWVCLVIELLQTLQANK